MTGWLRFAIALEDSWAVSKGLFPETSHLPDSQQQLGSVAAKPRAASKAKEGRGETRRDVGWSKTRYNKDFG